MHDSIIIVASTQDAAAPLIQLLAQNGYKSEVETSPEALVPTLHNSKHLIIIFDPENAFLEESELLEQIRQVNPNQPVILISDQQDPASLVKIANSGVNLLLESAIDQDALIQTASQFATSTENADICEFNPDQASAPKESVVSTPPPSPTHISMASPGGQHRLQLLWRYFQSSNHIFISGPKGTETDLIIAELSDWSKHPNRRTLWIDAEQLSTPETKQTLDQITGQDTFSTVIGINDFSQAPSSAHESIAKFIKFGYQKIIQGSSLSFLYHLEHDDLSHFKPELQALIKKNLIVFPPISERLADLAYYTHQFLEKTADEESWDSRATFSPQALQLLLSYSWPNNYTELTSFLRKIARLDDKSNIQAQTIIELLNLPDSTPANVLPAPLHDFLIAKQNQYLKDLSEQSSLSMQKILNQLDITNHTLNESNELETLLYPDISPESTAVKV